MPLQITILQQNFQLISLHGDAFTKAFYARLFETYPRLMPLFAHTTIEAQQQKFLMMLALIIEQLNTPKTLEPALKQLGQRHERYGVEPEHYAQVGSVLLTVLAEFMGKDWKPAWHEAWADAYTLIAGVMQGTHSLMAA